MASVSKEDRRRQEARRKHAKKRLAKASVIGMLAVVAPILAYLITQG